MAPRIFEVSTTTAHRPEHAGARPGHAFEKPAPIDAVVIVDRVRCDSFIGVLFFLMISTCATGAIIPAHGDFWTAGIKFRDRAVCFLMIEAQRHVIRLTRAQPAGRFRAADHAAPRRRLQSRALSHAQRRGRRRRRAGGVAARFPVLRELPRRKQSRLVSEHRPQRLLHRAQAQPVR